MGAQLSISDGSIQVAAETFDNLLPLPFEHEGRVVLRFVGTEGVLEVMGEGVTLTLLGEARFIEPGPPI